MSTDLPIYVYPSVVVGAIYKTSWSRPMRVEPSGPVASPPSPQGRRCPPCPPKSDEGGRADEGEGPTANHGASRPLNAPHSFLSVFTGLISSDFRLTAFGASCLLLCCSKSVSICSCLYELQKPAVMPIGWAVSAFPLSAFRFSKSVFICGLEFFATFVSDWCSN